MGLGKGLVLAGCALLLAGASCKKESKAGAQADPNDVLGAADRAGAGKPIDPASVDQTPINGVDVAGLDDKQKLLFYKLVDQMSSPCGKAHSLRTSVTSDAECKRAAFAARYLAALIADEANETDARELWEAKYKNAGKQAQLAVGPTVPHAGPIDAPIKIVEFYDYGCPACADFKAVADEIVRRNPSTVALFFKQYPLTDIHPNSMSAAQAALAAHQQGKFAEMHTLLFERSPAHTRADVMKYAQQLGLDMARFERDYAAAEMQVRADMKEGDAAGVSGTPTIYFQGRRYEGPGHPDYFDRWIQEDLAVNR